MNYNKIFIWITIILSISIPIITDYYFFPNSPQSVFLLYLIPIVIFSLYFNRREIIIATLFINSIHFIWGLIYIQILFPSNLSNRLVNHTSLLLLSVALAFVLGSYVTERRRNERIMQKSERLLANAQRIAHIGSWETNLITGNSYWSTETYRILGVDPVKFKPSFEAFLSFVPEGDRELVLRENEEACKGKPYDIEHRIIRKDGAVRIVREQAEVAFDVQGKPIQMIGTVQDITEQRTMEAQLAKSEERFRALVQNSYDIITIIDENATIKYKSPAYERVLGYQESDFDSLSAVNLIYPKDSHRARRVLMEALKKPGVPLKERLRIRHKNSNWLYCEVIITNLLQNQGIEGIVVNIRDMTEQKEALQQLEHKAYHDDLTDLLNKRGFSKLLEKEIEGDELSKFTILFLDLDGFKYVNDTLGHSVGDDLLIEIAQRLVELIKDRGYVARLGGDEFVILLKTNLHKSIKAAKEIIALFNQPILIHQYNFYMTASIGIVTYPSGGQDSETLLKNADIAMYKAKSSGKNTYKLYDQRIKENVMRSFLLQHDLREAIKNEEFTLYYQPRFNTVDQTINGVEALIRWVHPSIGFIQPSEFISIAESSGLIVELGEWVLETACKDLTEWGDLELNMSINVSAIQFMQVDLPDKIEQTLQRYNINPDRIELEITETAIIDQEITMQENITKLKELGVKFAIDDFGTGYSSLLYLKKFKIDTIKIDKSFISNIQEDVQNEEIVSSIVSLAKALKVKIVAEGVETNEQFIKIKEMDCDEVQGYYFSKPVTSSEVKKILNK